MKAGNKLYKYPSPEFRKQKRKIKENNERINTNAKFHFKSHNTEHYRVMKIMRSCH